MTTKYDAQIKRLIDNPPCKEIEWAAGEGIFGWVGKPKGNVEGIQEGCLTQIRIGSYGGTVMKAFTKGVVNEELTKEIAADTRIPTTIHAVGKEHYPVFLEWRLRIDKLEEE